MKTLITRTITGILFIAAMTAPFYLPHNPAEIFSFFFMLLCTILCTTEYINMARKNLAQPQKAFPVVIAAFAFFAFLFVAMINVGLALVTFALLFLLITIFLIVELYRNKENALVNGAVALFPLIWIVPSFALMTDMLFELPRYVLALFIVIWASDTLAYCAGSLFGKHRLFERISPKKSWEGFIVSLVLTVGGAISFGYIPYFSGILPKPYLWCLFALLVVIAGTFGDLVESLFKRACQVKDSGRLLPGHGGLLDRFDSLLFAAPVAYFFLVFMLKYYPLIF